MTDNNRDYIHGPDQDYVHHTKHIPAKKDHVSVACKVFAAPLLMALLVVIFSGSESLWSRMAWGFAYGYALQSLLVYSLNAIHSLITGESRGI